MSTPTIATGMKPIMEGLTTMTAKVSAASSSPASRPSPPDRMKNNGGVHEAVLDAPRAPESRFERPCSFAVSWSRVGWSSPVFRASAGTLIGSADAEEGQGNTAGCSADGTRSGPCRVLHKGSSSARVRREGTATSRRLTVKVWHHHGSPGGGP